MNAIIIALCVTVTVYSVPDVIARLRPGPPVWVSATSAIDSTGEFREQYFEPHRVEFLNNV
ncbi:MAG TPA: hypothetical protein VHY33_15620, partial [Thermoanaerobaculia bacterium]|nr:hypothetical protein [Thermoanaerobaculia bacterium]